jgi:hypothetical protein
VRHFGEALKRKPGVAEIEQALVAAQARLARPDQPR